MQDHFQTTHDPGRNGGSIIQEGDSQREQGVSPALQLQPEIQELEKALLAADETINALSKELAASEAQLDAVTGGAWNWALSYQISRRYLARVSKSLWRFRRTRVDDPKPRSASESRTTPVVKLPDEVINRLVDLAKREFRQGRNEAAGKIARLVNQLTPRHVESRRLLSLVEPLERVDGPPRRQRARHHLALADAHRLVGENQVAATNYRAALTFDNDLTDAQRGLAELRMPGVNYLTWIERIYNMVKPKTVLEIGVCQSASLACVPRQTVAIGVDPHPSVIFPIQAETHLFSETSDEFFAHRRAANLLGDQPLSVGFIDGLHLFEQALRDFIHLEAYCGPKSVIMFHDTVPLDELTQRRIPETHYSTGDVWKTILCLKHYRPDLDIFTIATQPTGLTVVSGLDPSSRVLEEVYVESVDRFIDMPFSVVEGVLETELNMVPNDENIVRARLEARGVI